MKQFEFFRNAFANSAELLLNTEAHMMSHLKWIAETKRQAVEKMAYGNEFNSDDICDFDDWDQKDIPHDTMMKVVKVKVGRTAYFLIDMLKSRRNDWGGELFDIEVFFMCDPDTILKSKARLTKEEERVLKEMRGYYINGRDKDTSHLRELISDLKDLKHKYRICFDLTWSYGFDQIMEEDFLENGLLANGVVITRKQ